MSLDHDRVQELGRIRTPSMVIGTKDDCTVPSYLSEDFQAATAGSTLHIMENGGHYSYRYNAPRFDEVLRAFLEGRGA